MPHHIVKKKIYQSSATGTPTNQSVSLLVIQRRLGHTRGKIAKWWENCKMVGKLQNANGGKIAIIGIGLTP